MAAALTLTAATAASPGIAGIKTGGNSNGINSAAYTFSGGTPGADTITNAELLKGVQNPSRLREFLAKNYATQAALDSDMAALGIITNCNGGSALRFITAAPGVPTATVTTAVATGSLRISLGGSIEA
jgi:hypothetical protein